MSHDNSLVEVCKKGLKPASPQLSSSGIMEELISNARVVAVPPQQWPPFNTQTQNTTCSHISRLSEAKLTCNHRLNSIVDSISSLIARGHSKGTLLRENGRELGEAVL